MRTRRKDIVYRSYEKIGREKSLTFSLINTLKRKAYDYLHVGYLFTFEKRMPQDRDSVLFDETQSTLKIDTGNRIRVT